MLQITDAHLGRLEPGRISIDHWDDFISKDCPADSALVLDIPFFEMSADHVLLDHVRPDRLKTKINELAGRVPLGQKLHGPLFDMINRDYVLGHLSNERLWSHVVIPELSAIVVATVSGRCAIYSMLEGLDQSEETTTLAYLQLDHILPFRDQEECGDRPVACLRGIAAAPIDPNKKQHQWRLFLHYDDNTVLCYLLGRDDLLSLAGRVPMRL
jgi:hypothetical protein